MPEGNLHHMARPTIDSVCVTFETRSDLGIKHIGMKLGIVVLDGRLAINDQLWSNLFRDLPATKCHKTGRHTKRSHG